MADEFLKTFIYMKKNCIKIYEKLILKCYKTLSSHYYYNSFINLLEIIWKPLKTI